MKDTFIAQLIHHVKFEIEREEGENTNIEQVLVYTTHAGGMIHLTVLFKGREYRKFTEKYALLQNDYRTYFEFIHNILGECGVRK